jgi:rare lipoprotein A
MRSSASTLAALAALAGCSGGANEMSRPPLAAAPAVASPAPAPLPPEAGTREGPSGTSGQGAARYDQVGYASWYGEELGGAPTASGAAFAPDAITAAHRSLPLGSHAEVTALDTGRTILVLVNDRGPGRADREIDLSRGAAALLGMNGQPTAPVRVRGVVAAPTDAAALAAGRPAAPRLDAPPALLAGLRHRLTPLAAPIVAQPNRPATPPPVRTAAAPRPRVPVAGKAYVVQIAAFSSEPRARSLAATLRGYVEPAGTLYRVRLGPFADPASAERARDGAARRGYGDSTIIVQP